MGLKKNTGVRGGGITIFFLKKTNVALPHAPIVPFPNGGALSSCSNWFLVSVFTSNPGTYKDQLVIR